MDAPSSPGGLGLGPTLAQAWRSGSAVARTLMVAWALLPFAAFGVALAVREPPEQVTELPPAGVTALVQRHRLEQDAAARVRVTNLVPVIERCGRRTRDFTQCATPEQLAPYGGGALPLSAGPEPGRVAVTATLPRTYTVTGGSRTGGQFAITRTKRGVYKRTCTIAGKDGCGAAGRW